MELEWKKISSIEYGKIVFHSIPYHALRYTASCNILAVNNNPFEDFAWRFLFCHINKQLEEYMYDQGGPKPFNSNSIINITSISPISFFFKSVLPRKKWRSGNGLLLKNVTIDSYDY